MTTFVASSALAKPKLELTFCGPKKPFWHGMIPSNNLPLPLGKNWMS